MTKQKKRPNIVFSTTRGWNPGDEFILFGIINLFKDLLKDFNPIIYNRNPELHVLRLRFNRSVEYQFNDQKVTANLYPELIKNLGRFDNSWRDNIDPKMIDMIVFAGSPEWLGSMNDALVTAALEHDIPVMYLGVGSFEGTQNLTFDTLPKKDAEILNLAKLITVRDKTCQRILEPLEAIYLPCPALFSSLDNKTHKKIKRIALSTQGVGQGRVDNVDKRNPQPIKQTTLAFTQQLFQRLNKDYDCGLVLHYINEMEELSSVFADDDIPLHYSFDAKDYLDLYNDFDLTVSTRVHGVGLCASLGIPGFCVAHSKRSDTAEGFLATLIDPETASVDDIVEQIKALDIKTKSHELHRHKKSARKAYHALLKPIFSDIFPEHLKRWI